jgi:hypothetical protein
MNVIGTQRFLIPLGNGETINVLVEEQGNPRLYKFAAVLNDWDADCKFETGNSVDEAVGNLADLLDVTLPDDWRTYGSSSRLRCVEVAGAAA